MKAFLRKFVSQNIIEKYRSFAKQRRIMQKSGEEVFTEIYEKNLWGGARGDFYSGSGSSDGQVVPAYVSMIFEVAAAEGLQGMRFVDLGCGDFQVGGQVLTLCSTYTGVDVVKPLIARNQEKFGTERVSFKHLDITRDELPEGDVCFIRQVFQHLSNAQIKSVLPKLRKYKWVFITEHYPDDGPSVRPNKDKVHGADIRILRNSGVYLSESPFNLPAQSMKQVLEVSGTVAQQGLSPGVIRTFLYKPGT